MGVVKVEPVEGLRPKSVSFFDDPAPARARLREKFLKNSDKPSEIAVTVRDTDGYLSHGQRGTSWDKRGTNVGRPVRPAA